MKWAVYGLLLLSPGLAHGAVSANELARQIREISLDPAECYRVRDLALPKDDARIFLTDGYLIFSKPIAGSVVAAVFTTDVEGGDSEMLVMPPNRGERRSLASYTGSPTLDEHLAAGVMVFSDDTYSKLAAAISQNSYNHKVPEMGAMMGPHWTPVVRNIAGSFQTRLIWDLLLGQAQSHGFMAFSVSGRRLGNFDLYYDRSAREQLIIGKLNTRGDLLYFDIWTSFVARSFRDKNIDSDLALDDFRIQAALQPDLSLRVVTRVKAKPQHGPLPVLSFDIARPMKVSSALVDGRPAEVFQRESMRAELLRNVGNDLFVVVPPEPLQPGKEYELEFHHEGKVIFDAGNQVYYVGARSNWFPNNELQFATFDLTFRYPKGLDLVTAGQLLEDNQEGDDRITRRKTTVPIRMAGFNLGQYERVRIAQDGYTVEVCANRSIEPALAGQPAAGQRATAPSAYESDEIASMPDLSSDPLARLRELAAEIASTMQFMASRFGPPALPSLTVSPVPGRFGQGFPGLIYLSTLSYLAPAEQAFRNLDPHGRLFFSRLLQAHETAHQWWGNIVTSAGYHDEWLMEALADYSALLYLENKAGDQPVDLVLDTYKKSLLQQSPAGHTVEATGPIVLGVRLENSQTPQAYHAITYGKGCWIMHMLRERMGVENFVAMLAGLRRQYERKTISTEDFRIFASHFLPPKSPDPELENFFDQWVYGTGIPELKLNYAIKGKAPALTLVGSVLQTDVDSDFSVNVPVQIELAGGKKVTQWVTTGGGPADFRMPLKQAPVSVVLDPDDAVLRK